MTTAADLQYLRGGQQIASGLGQYYNNSSLGGTSNALGILAGLQSGGIGGYGSAATNAGRLAGNYLGSKSLGTGAGELNNLLQIYQGINQGGLRGYGTAAANSAQLAGTVLDNPALGTVGGALAIPLAAYNAVENYQSGKTGQDALNDAELGATVGTYLGPLGTVAGGVIGGAVGALSSAFGPGAKDPETAGVQGIIDATSKYGNNPAVAASVQNPYLGLAGLMDRRSSTLPMYAQYGRMGEQKFTNDMVDQINQAVKANPALAHDPNAVYNQVVAPWVNKMGSGYSNVGQTYTGTTQGLLQDMTNEYMSGNAAQDWKAIGGDSPFSNIYQNSPFTAAPPPPPPPPTTADRLGALRPGTQLRAQGGTVKDKKLRSRLHQLYEASYAGRKRAYDDGGSVDYFTPDLPSADSTGAEYQPYQVDPSQFYNPTTDGNTALEYANQEGIDSINNPYAGSSLSDSSGSSGILGGLGSLLGVSSMGQLIQKYGALAPLLASVLGQNKPASAPATPAGYGAIPSIPTPSNPRTYTQPSVPNWYTYGQGPEQSFFSNNQLPTIPGMSPPASAPPSAGAPGQMTTQPVGYNPTTPPPIVRARGGSSFDSQQGDSYVSDPGHGDGTSDDIDAKLSGGEYVMDAGTVSMLGNGSNEAGSRALDQLRQRVRKHAGKQLVKGKQFMKAKPPETYLRKAAGK